MICLIRRKLNKSSDHMTNRANYSKRFAQSARPGLESVGTFKAIIGFGRSSGVTVWSNVQLVKSFRDAYS